MEDIIELKNYDLFITDVSECGIVKAYSIYEDTINMNIDCIAHFKIKLLPNDYRSDNVNFANTHKILDGELIKLEEDEIPPQELNKMEVLEKQIRQQEEAIGLIATQVAKNTLLQNGGMRI